MNNIICPTRRLEWCEVCDLVEKRIAVILGHQVSCTAWEEDASYWSVSAIDYRFPISEIRALLDAVDANHEVRSEALPEDSEASRSFGMGLSSRLLRAELSAEWEHEFHTERALWLINYTENEKAGGADLQLSGTDVWMQDLKSRQELLAYLGENGPTHTTLMEFCESYRDRYQNELCWSYPISDGKHLGTFLVPVREGILSLPYDDADKVDYELFCLDDVRMFSAADMKDFIESWERFSDDLISAMRAMQKYLRRRESLL